MHTTIRECTPAYADSADHMLEVYDLGPPAEYTPCSTCPESLNANLVGCICIEVKDDPPAFNPFRCMLYVENPLENLLAPHPDGLVVRHRMFGFRLTKPGDSYLFAITHRNGEAIVSLKGSIFGGCEIGRFPTPHRWNYHFKELSRGFGYLFSVGQVVTVRRYDYA